MTNQSQMLLYLPETSLCQTQHRIIKVVDLESISEITQVVLGYPFSVIESHLSHVGRLSLSAVCVFTAAELQKDA